MPVAPNSLANLKPFRNGFDERRARGRPCGGASFLEWLDILSAERASGKPRYTLRALKAIADADDDAPVSPMKRAAARALCEVALPGRRGREALLCLLNRTLGMPRRTSEVRKVESQRIVIVPPEAWPDVCADYARQRLEEHGQAPAGLLPPRDEASP